MDKVILGLQLISYFVAGAVVALTGISKLTKTLKDDKLLAFFLWVDKALRAIVVPTQPTAKAFPAK